MNYKEGNHVEIFVYGNKPSHESSEIEVTFVLSNFYCLQKFSQATGLVNPMSTLRFEQAILNRPGANFDCVSAPGTHQLNLRSPIVLSKSVRRGQILVLRFVHKTP